METKDVIDFFDKCASFWDAEIGVNESVLERILCNAGVCEGKTVLDVACGTGVLFPYYLKHGVKNVLGVDISPKMIEKAKQKYAGNKAVNLLCTDVQTLDTAERFDCIMVYNALPHFENAEHLIKVLCRLLSSNGSLSIAHGASRAEINACHKGGAVSVSTELISAQQLAAVFEKYLRVETVIDDGEMYQVSGVKREVDA